MNPPGGYRDLSELTPTELLARCRYYICGSDGKPDDRCALNAIHSMALIELAEKYMALSLTRPDDSEPITEPWLSKVGLSTHSLRMSMLLPPVGDGAIVELSLTPDGSIPFGGGLPIGKAWIADLTQGVPDDPNVPDDHVTITSRYFRTRRELRELCRGLGITLTGATP